MTTEQIIVLGTAPNPMQNTTLKKATSLMNILSGLIPLRGIVVNLTMSWPAEAAMVLTDGQELPDDVPLYLHLVAVPSDRAVYLGAANLLKIIETSGQQAMAKMVLDVVLPGWETDDARLALVAALPGLPPPVTSFSDPLVEASPDWEQPKGDGVLACRPGDFTKDGTEYVSPATGARWRKGPWLSITEYTWKKV